MSEQKVIVGEIITCLNMIESHHLKKVNFPFHADIKKIKDQLESEYPKIFKEFRDWMEFVSLNLSNLFTETIYQIQQWERTNNCQSVLQLMVFENTAQKSLCGENVEK
jgi:hypothetical protein